MSDNADQPDRAAPDDSLAEVESSLTEPAAGCESEVAASADSLRLQGDVSVGPRESESPLEIRTQSWPFRLWSAVFRGLEWCFGLASLLVALAVVASVPILQFISLGYLLEVSGRISRSGRLRDGFFEIRRAGQIGSLFLGTWLMLLPLRFVSDMAYNAALIDPESRITWGWRIGLVIVTWLMVAHILLAWYCGGRLRHFFWPLLAPVFFGMWLLRHAVSRAVSRPRLARLLSRVSPRLLNDLTSVPKLESWFPPAILRRGWRDGGMYVQARDAVWDFVVGLRLPYYFWLGLRGFVGAIVWLTLPVLMIIATTRLSLDDPEAGRGLGALLGFVGSLLLATVMLYLPFLQAHLAAEQRFAAIFEWREVRRQFRRAPIAFWFALFNTLLFALPLYLLKIEFVPREVIWLPSLVFVVFIFPARMITGWALGRARHRSEPRHKLARWLSRFAAVPVVLAYVFIVFFTQYTSWYGPWSLFEQHAVLTPVPFLEI